MSREYAKRLIDKKYRAPVAKALKNSAFYVRNQFIWNMDPQWMPL